MSRLRPLSHYLAQPLPLHTHSGPLALGKFWRLPAPSKSLWCPERLFMDEAPLLSSCGPGNMSCWVGLESENSCAQSPMEGLRHWEVGGS